jgi:hypothetical protein
VTDRRSLFFKTAVAAATVAVAASVPTSAQALTPPHASPRQAPALTGSGAVNLLAQPIRLLDTRNPPYSMKLAAGKTLTLNVTNNPIGGISIPTGAKAVFGNVTIAAPDAPGFLTLYPADGTLPLASNINYDVSSYALANFCLVGLSATNAANYNQLTIYCANGSTHVIFDAAGYVL